MSAKLQLLFVLLIATITARGETVRLEDEGLTFTLPPEWVAIPKQELVRRFAEVQKNQAAIKMTPWKYGYQKAGADWFYSPFLVIGQQETKRVPESEIRDLQNIDLNAIAKKAARGSDLFDKASLGKPSYDPTTQQVWIEAQGTSNDGTKVHSLEMIQLTENGATFFTFNAAADQYAELRLVFLKTLESVTPDPEIVYRFDPTVAAASTDSDGGMHDPRFWGTLSGPFVTFAIVFFIAYAVTKNRRRALSIAAVLTIIGLFGWCTQHHSSAAARSSCCSNPPSSRCLSLARS